MPPGAAPGGPGEGPREPARLPGWRRMPRWRDGGRAGLRSSPARHPLSPDPQGGGTEQAIQPGTPRPRAPPAPRAPSAGRSPCASPTEPEPLSWPRWPRCSSWPGSPCRGRRRVRSPPDLLLPREVRAHGPVVRPSPTTRSADRAFLRPPLRPCPRRTSSSPALPRESCSRALPGTLPERIAERTGAPASGSGRRRRRLLPGGGRGRARPARAAGAARRGRGPRRPGRT